MTIIYDEQFNDSLETMLREHKYWVYMVNVHPSNYLKYEDNLVEIRKRIKKDEGGLRIERLSGDKDVFDSSLNARTELVPGIRVPYNDHYHLYTSVYFDDEVLNSTFLQILGKDNNNKTKPLLTLDTRAGNMHVRTHDFSKDPSGYFERFVLANYKEDLYRKTIEFDVFFYPDTTSGYFKVFMNQKLVFERLDSPTYWSKKNGKLQLQYGCYGTDGSYNYETVVYKRLLLQKNESREYTPYKKESIEEESSEEKTSQEPLELNSEKDKVYENLLFENINDNAIVVKNCQDIIFRNCIFRNCTGEGIQLNSCKNIEIYNCEFSNVRTGVYAVNSVDISVHHCDCSNVQGPMPRGQFVQFNNVTGKNNYIGYSVITNTLNESNPEDIINLYKSSGEEGFPIIVENNYINGGGPSKSGGGIMSGDNGGQYQIIRNNVLVNPGQYGIACAGGEHISIARNQVYGKQQSFTNVGIYVWKQKASVLNEILVEENQVSFINNEGNENPWWNGGNATNLTLKNNEWDVAYREPQPNPDQGTQNKDTPDIDPIPEDKISIRIQQDDIEFMEFKNGTWLFQLKN